MIYLDNAATTPLDREVVKAMSPFYSVFFGNPSSMHQAGRRAAEAIEAARKTVASILNCTNQEIFFTAGGTEADNLAIFGLLKPFLADAEKYHIITTNVEHAAVLNSFKRLAKEGLAVTYLKVDKYGLINENDLIRALRPETILVSIIYANNEIGTIQPIRELAGVIKNYRHIQRIDTVSKNPFFPVFHIDACQAAGYLSLDTCELGIDLMSLNGSKIYGPKQIGVLYKKKEVALSPLLCGGDQEGGLRPGTENTPAIVGMARALEIASRKRIKETKRLRLIRDYFIMEALKIPGAVLNGHHRQRLPNNVNISFMGVEGEALLLKLDQQGVCVSTGSACHAMSLEPSHVVLALDGDHERAHCSIRFTMGRETTKKDMEKVLKILSKAVKDLRKISAIK